MFAAGWLVCARAGGGLPPPGTCTIPPLPHPLPKLRKKKIKKKSKTLPPTVPPRPSRPWLARCRAREPTATASVCSGAKLQVSAGRVLEGPGTGAGTRGQPAAGAAGAAARRRVPAELRGSSQLQDVAAQRGASGIGAWAAVGRGGPGVPGGCAGQRAGGEEARRRPRARALSPRPSSWPPGSPRRSAPRWGWGRPSRARARPAGRRPSQLWFPPEPTGPPAHAPPPASAELRGAGRAPPPPLAAGGRGRTRRAGRGVRGARARGSRAEQGAARRGAAEPAACPLPSSSRRRGCCGPRKRASRPRRDLEKWRMVEGKVARRWRAQLRGAFV